MKKGKIYIQSVFFIFLLMYSVFSQNSSKKNEQNTTIEHNKKLVLRLFGEVFNKKSLSTINDLYELKVVDHSAFPEQAPGIAGIKSAISGFFEIFNDLEVTVEDVIASDDKVVTREVWKGTHKPSGKTAEGTVIHIFKIHDGKITEEWSRGWDWLEKL